MSRLNELVRYGGMVLIGVAIYQELQKPPEERTWHGKVMDFFPYEFRVPTVDRLMSRVWNPEDPRIFMPTMFGVGWTVNLGRLYYLLSGKISPEEGNQAA
ncbi:MAG: DUF5808 domain-containing protein [Chloroflexi bacterium]|nr:DUF5808 domain-containing protein [Chloroflexota bacterium]MCL5107547.1 DUF5808 domain-containing protein [Chloroflexota bacterium]